MTTHLRSAVAALMALVALAACKSGPIASTSTLSASEVPAAIERASNASIPLASSAELAEIVGLMVRANQAVLEPGQRLAVRQLLERSAEELAARGDDPDDLEDLVEAELPARIAVPAGVRAARLHFESGERADAFKVLQRIDRLYPSHPYRQEAGDLLFEIAEDYRTDKGSRFFIFKYAARAPGVYEYLSAEYPTHDKTDDALFTLAGIYEGTRLFGLAIEKHLELIVWAQSSTYRIESEADIPRLRLEDLDGPEYGRDAMIRALSELELWIESYGDHELRAQVDRTLVDCLQRLADNDLVVARFYARIKNPTGARQHADRGLTFARRAGNPEQIDEIVAFLEGVDEIERVDAPRLFPDELEVPDAFDPGGTGTSTPGDLVPGARVDEPNQQER
ncbi:MAG: hypothetical protein VX015_06570 [Planctomycetota bacterium]|nr:hypothetical protein [Planctomycetota bacterium]